MYRYFFQPEERAKYYNCSGRTYEEWRALGSPNVAIGITYITLGIFFFVIYFPFMVVFLKSDLLKHSCYKIMFFLGIIDMIQIPYGASVGYLSIVGMVFCMAPDFNYFFGGFGFGLWIAGSSTCMLLSLNRCIDILNHNLAVTLFQEKKTYVWIAIPVMYGLCVWLFYPSVVFSSQLHAFVFDPFIGTPERHGTLDGIHYPYKFLFTHNVAVVVWLAFAYGGLCLKLTFMSHGLSSLHLNHMQRQAFMTALLICTGTFVAALVYCFMQFLPVPAWVAFVGEVGWQTSHGMVGITYLLMNKTMRKEAVKIFFSKSDSAVGASTAPDTQKTDSNTFITY